MPKPANKQEKLHMRAVASLGCVVCRNLGFTPQQLDYTAIHHVRWNQGIAQRASHYLTLGLCGGHHQTGGNGVAFHAGPAVWQARYGSELTLLIQTYMMLQRAGELNLLPADNGCGCHYCEGGWRDLLREATSV